MTRRIRTIQVLAVFALMLALPSIASAAPAPWGDKNNVDATVCSTYHRDGTQAIVKPTPGTDTTCVKPGGGGNQGSAPSDPVVGSPTEGAEYLQGEVVNVSYSCSDPDQTMTTPANCKGYQCPPDAADFGPCTLLTPAADDPSNVYGHTLDTSVPGDYVFSVWAVDDQNNLNSTIVHFTVVADSDSDGVKDSDDLCPGTAAGAVVDVHGCSLEQSDSDGDGVNDALDQCPGTTAGATVDANGCSLDQLDSDGDGVNDALDKCPNTAAGAAVNADGCSLSQLDSDSDGVNDALDKCPNTAAGAAVNADGCSLAQRDSDGDGVNDALDKCPGTPAGKKVDANGCVPIVNSNDGSKSNDGSNSGSGSGSNDGSKSNDGSNSGSGSNDGSNSGSGSNDGSNSGSNDGSTSSSDSSSVPSDSGAAAGIAAGTAVVNASDGEQLVLGARLAGCNIVLQVSRKQKSFRSKGLLVRIRSNRACAVKLSGRLIPAKSAKSRKAKVRTQALTIKLNGRQFQTVKLRFTKQGLRYLKRSLMGKVTRARIFVTDGPGVLQKLNRSFTVRIKG